MIVQTLGGYGPEPSHLTTLQVCLGGVAVFGVAMIAVRFAARRPLSEAAPLYMVLGVLLGASLSQTLPGPSPIIPAMVCAALLALVCRLIGREPFRRFEDLLRGRGGVRQSAQNPDSESVSRQTFHFERGLADPQASRFATLVRNGRIGAVPRRQA